MANVDIMTYDEAHYFDIGTTETPDINLGIVFTQLDENSNPVESEKQYIGDKSKTTKVTGFSNEFPITSDLVQNDKVSEYFYGIFRNRKTGSDAQVTHYIVELWNPTTAPNYKARKIVESVSITGKIAGTGEQINFTGSLKGVGDFIDGTFNTETKVFTPTV